MASTANAHLEMQPMLEDGEAGFSRVKEKEAQSSIGDEAKGLRLKPAYRTIAKTAVLISTWCVSSASSKSATSLGRQFLKGSWHRYLLSTLLSMWNRKLLGKEKGGVLDLGPFPGNVGVNHLTKVLLPESRQPLTPEFPPMQRLS